MVKQKGKQIHEFIAVVSTDVTSLYEVAVNETAWLSTLKAFSKLSVLLTPACVRLL